MKNTRKILVALLVLMTILVSLAAVAIPASAEITTRTIYLNLTGSNWPDANAWVEAWVWGSKQNSDAWYKFTDADGDGYYEIQVPDDATGMKLVRRGPTHTQGSWDGTQKWAETGDLTISSNKNCYTLTGWNTSGSWSSFTPVSCKKDYDAYGKCTNTACTTCHFYTITGNDAEIFGSAWKPESGNKMLYNSSTSTYSYVVEGVDAGDYAFKCIKDGDAEWNGAIGGTGNNADNDGNYVLKVAVNNSTITITLKDGVISATVEHVHSWVDATCTDPQKCSCGETQGETLDHSYVDGACSACGAEDPNYVPPCQHEYAYACDKVCALCFEETNPEADHNIIAVDAVDATCYENGNIAYWYCEYCGIAWADEALTQQTNLKNVVVPMAHGTIAHVEAVAPTCYENGNLEYWYCTAENCGQVWLDEACTLKTTLKAMILPMAHAEATHVAANAATCTENGNIEYWYCAECGQAWLDAECTLNTNLKAVILPMADHSYVDGKCECGEEDPNYAPPVEDDEKPEDETPADPQPEAPAEPEAELNFFQKIIKAITEFFANIGNWFKNLFAKK